MNIAFVQAREKSNRLPKKVLQKIVGKTVLEHVVERVRRAKLVDRVIVLTGSETNNKGISKICNEAKIDFLNGSDNDVLLRFVQALDYYEVPDSAKIIRITADCPLIDSEIIDFTISKHKNSMLRYSSTSLENLLPDGLDVEIIDADLLREIDKNTTSILDREHVTHYIYKSGKYEINHVRLNRSFPEIRLTLDYEEDYILLKSIYERLYYDTPHFTLEDVLQLYEFDAGVFDINLKYSRNEGLVLTTIDDDFRKNNFSRLSLGTANLGMNYGHFNIKGQIKTDEFLKIVELSLSYGIHNIDTASAYGVSESVLGKLHNNLKTFKISGKYSGSRIDELGRILTPIEEAKKSLESLNRKSFDCYYLHNPKHLYDFSIMQEMNYVKDLGMADVIGVSVYEIEDAVNALNNDFIDLVQIKYNIFDFFNIDNNVLKLAKMKGKKVFVRSVFLQGLLLIETNKLPLKFGELYAFFKHIDEVANDYSLTRLELILFFVYMNKEIDQILIGIDSLEQLYEIIDATNNIRINDELYRKLKNDFRYISSNLLNPTNWGK
jgi:spore coat polysaccharide biosynthesis protein SpsF (cytidylyltransferase family)/aryl-alcohol dehydrogenase-like predicted oxidoreductase